MPNELSQLDLSKEQQEKLPLAYQKIFVKKILSQEVEDQLAIPSQKYGKVDFGPLKPLKPISKIVQ